MDDKIILIILISGKRKCGKDFISEKLKQRLGQRAKIIHISEPIKLEWAAKFNLNLNELLSDSSYKEIYRKDMIEWSDSVRLKDYSYFCRKAMENASTEFCIVSDVRRKNDIKFFREVYGERVKTVRISCPDSVRIQRGWNFTSGVDDVASECDLDDYAEWDVKLNNDNSSDIQMCIDMLLSKLEIY